MSFIRNIKATVPYFKTQRKIIKLKQRVSDVQALNRSARGNQVRNGSEQLQVNRAAGERGLNPGMLFARNPRRIGPVR